MTFNDLYKRLKQLKYDLFVCVSEQQELRELGHFPQGDNVTDYQFTRVSDDKVINYLAKLDALKQKQQRLEEKIMLVRSVLLERVNEISEELCRIVCYEKILNGKRWKEIMGKIDRSYSYTRLLFDKGFKKIKNTEVNYDFSSE